MSQMPRGEPRSVPDPDGEQYDEMLRQEGLNARVAEARYSSDSDYFSPDYQPGVPLPNSVPNTSRDALFCADPEAVSPQELANRRRAIERAFLMANSPLAGAAYGLASLADASPDGRDQALAAGGAADAVMMGVAPFGAAFRGRPASPTVAVGPVGWQRDAIRHGDLNANRQATGISATLTASMLGTGTRANWRQTPHLAGRQLGGRGVPRNIVNMTQNGANSPQMSSFENRVARRVRAGEVIDYSATPLYNEGALPPSAVLVTATGSRQPPAAKLIRNPAATRR
jgi:hypothetical protein